MTAIEKEVLQNGLCAGCDCTGFEPSLTYALDVKTKKLKITDSSKFGTGDDLKKVLVHVYDKNGKEKHGIIETAKGSVDIDVSSLTLSNISITATVIAKQGCKADFGSYEIGTITLTGELGNIAKQGNRNVK